jgi:hypothetical protein
MSERLVACCAVNPMVPVRPAAIPLVIVGAPDLQD